jgi:hypothetical protein
MNVKYHTPPLRGTFHSPFDLYFHKRIDYQLIRGARMELTRSS